MTLLRDREAVKEEIRKKALEKLEGENSGGEGDQKVGNFKIIVVGQQTNKELSLSSKSTNKRVDLGLKCIC